MPPITMTTNIFGENKKFDKHMVMDNVHVFPSTIQLGNIIKISISNCD